MTATDRDRATAAEALSEWGTFAAGDGYPAIGRLTDAERIERVAAALAAERDRALAPIEALADEMAAEARDAGLLLDRCTGPWDRIRAAVAEGRRQ